MEVVMDNIIDVSIPVAEVVDKHPEVLEILVELGFKPLTNPLMRNTVGRKVSLKQGSKPVSYTHLDVYKRQVFDFDYLSFWPHPGGTHFQRTSSRCGF